MHLSITTDAGTFKGAADKILSFGDKKFTVVFFNAYLSEKDVILDQLKKISEVAKSHIFNFRAPVAILLSDYRLEYIIEGDESVVKAFYEELGKKLKVEPKHDRLELPFELWHLIPIGEHFIPILGAL
jgi:hypothetical protein